MLRHGPLMLLLAACSSGPPDPRSDDSPTFGHVLVLADQDLRPVLEDQRTTFEALYEKARVDLRYLPERQLVQAMLNDSVRAVFGTFLPGGDQQAYFRTRQLTPFTEAVATDAIAVLSHPAGPDSLSLEELRGILTDLRRSGLIVSQRSANGGFRLARPASEITIAEVVRSVEGPLALVRGLRPTELDYPGATAPLRDVWIALRANLRAVLDHTTIADVAEGRLPELVRSLAADPDSWL